MEKQLKVVVTDAEYETMEAEEREMKRIGAELVRYQCKTEQELIDCTSDADGLLVQYAHISRRVIENLRNCRIIVRYGIGIDCIDVEAATDHGVMVANVPNYGLEDVADHTMALMLSLARKIVLLNSSVKEGTWDYQLAKPLHRLSDQTLGLVAFGSIARMVASRAKAFGLKVQVFDPHVSLGTVSMYGVDAVDFATLISTSDIISLHVPLMDATRHMFKLDVFRLMKPGAILVNTARGALIEECDLVQALKEGYLAGAALDVTEEEPISPDSPLLRMNNVIITPHAAWYTEQAQQALQRIAAEEMARVLSGGMPVNLVNREVLKRSSYLERRVNVKRRIENRDE